MLRWIKKQKKSRILRYDKREYFPQYVVSERSFISIDNAPDNLTSESD